MTPEDFIKKNPFPKNGTEINNQLVLDIQNPELADRIEYNIEKLMEVNARVIFLVYKQFNYNQSLSSIMSFVYEGIRFTAKEYRVGSPKPYYSYLMSYVRGLLQKNYNYSEHLVHVPVMKKKVVETTIEDLDMLNTEPTGTDDNHYEDLYELIEDFMKNAIMSQEKRAEYEMIIGTLSDKKSLEDIAKERKCSINNIRRMKKAFEVNLKKFYRKRMGR